MTVIIRTGGRTGRDRHETVKQLVALANGNLRHIVSTTSGVEVPDELAYEYLRDLHVVPVTVEYFEVVADPDPGTPVPLAEVIEAPAEKVEQILAEPKPKKRKPRKPATISEGAE